MLFFKAEGAALTGAEEALRSWAILGQGLHQHALTKAKAQGYRSRPRCARLRISARTPKRQGGAVSL